MRPTGASGRSGVRVRGGRGNANAPVGRGSEFYSDNNDFDVLPSDDDGENSNIMVIVLRTNTVRGLIKRGSEQVRQMTFLMTTMTLMIL